MSKVTSANIFLPDKVYCIHCNSELHKRPAACGACGFSVGYLRGMFRTAPPEIVPFLNLHNELKQREKRKIVNQIRKFERRFLQQYLSVNILPLTPEVRIKEFVFWLHNSSSSRDERALTRTSILLIDPSSRNVALSLGYQVEPFVRLQDTKPLLKTLSSSVKREQLTSGIINFIKDYKIVMEKSWKRAMRTAKENARSSRR